MKWVGVMPFVHQPYRDECVATMAPGFMANLIEIDNTKVNKGIMWSHNQGLELAQDIKADWLIVMSAAIRFGKAGGLDFIKALEDHPDHHVLSAATPNVTGGQQQTGDGGKNGIYGWHLIAFRRDVLDNVGGWDQNFTPYSLDDLDLSLRIQKFYGKDLRWDTYPCDVSDTTMGHSINLGGVKATYEPRNSYYTRKWGRGGGSSENLDDYYDHPFNDKTYSLDYWPKPHEPLSIDKVEFKNGRDYEEQISK